MQINVDELRALIAAGESETVELKGSGVRPIELAERLCGLANTDGGWVIMGVNDATLAPEGVSNVKYAKDNLVQASRRCQPALFFMPPTPLVVDIDGAEIVYVYVPPSVNTLYQAGGVFWSRKGSQTVPMTIEEVTSWSYSRGLIRWERLPCRLPTALIDLDMQRVARFLSVRSADLLRHGDDNDALQGLEAAVDVAGRGVVPTHAGLLMFGARPQSLIQQAEIDCVEWRDPQNQQTGLGGWVDRRRLTGPLPDLIEATLNFVATHIPTSAVVSGTQRVETPAYPLEAIREAVVNAVVHRDYSLEGQVTRVFIYHDHIEVRSPGQLLPGVTVEALKQGRLLSKARNPILASLLRDWPDARYIERLGAGMRLMMGAMHQRNLPAPLFEELANEFIVSFFSTNASVPDAPVQQQTRPIERAQNLPALAKHDDIRFAKLNARQVRGLEFVQRQGRINNAEYRTLNEINDRTAARELGELRDLGILVQRGGGRSLYYERAAAKG